MKPTSKHPLDNSTPLETIFGFILTSETKRATEAFNQIDVVWLKNPFHKRIHTCMKQLIEKHKQIDLLSLTMQFRENGWMEQDVAVRISRLTNFNNDLNARLYIENVFNEMRLIESVIRATSFKNEFDQLIESGNMTIEKFNAIVDQLKRVDFDFESKSRSNPDVVFDVLVDHENAKIGKMVGIELSYPCLKQIVMLEPVDVMVVGARPAMGKTAFGVSTMCRLAHREKKIVYFSLEMSKKQMMRRIIANLTDIDSNAIKYGHLSDDQFRRVSAVQNWDPLNNMIVIEGTKSINDIANHLSEITREHEIDLFVVDYLQKIQPKNTRSRYEQVTEISNGIKLIAQNMNIPCLALAQLSRDSSKTGKRPSLPDLKESGEIEQDASIVAFLHRPEYYGETETFNGSPATDICEFIIGKNREGELGIFEMSVNLATSKFNG
jgi:replicative DNA helicase